MWVFCTHKNQIFFPNERKAQAIFDDGEWHTASNDIIVITANFIIAELLKTLSINTHRRAKRKENWDEIPVYLS